MWWNMGGYGIYVWPAFSFVFIGLALVMALSINNNYRLQQAIKNK